MRNYKSMIVLSLLLVSALACDRPETVDDEEAEVVERPDLVETEDIGEVHFQTSCNEEAQAHFEVGLGLLHHMWYVKARESFENVLAADEDCAMGYWGIAMTHYTPLWAPPEEESLQAGAQAVGQARQLEIPTEREQAFVDAIAAYYEDYEEVEHRERTEAFLRGWEQAYERDRSDIEAASFYALAILATAPTVTETYDEQRRAGQILEEVLEEEPRHPAGHHYLIHAYDFEPLAEDALEVARSYADIAPSVPHALHMPSHIFVRLGMWQDNIEWNLRSADAAEEHEVNGRTSLHFYHALDYVAYGYLQQGLDEEAEQIADRARRAENPQVHAGSAYSSVAIPARIALEQRDWGAAAEVTPLHDEEELQLDRFPAIEVTHHAVRAVGAVFADDVEGAQREFEQLEEANRAAAQLDDPHWTPHAQAYRDMVEALIEYSRGNTDEGIEMLEAVTEFQNSFDKHPIMPGRILEAGEYLGLILHDDGQYTQALQAYEDALEMTPNRYHLYYGAAISARQAGEPDMATHYYSRLLELADPDVVDRREVREALEFLEPRAGQ